MKEFEFEKIVSHLKSSGFVFPGSQIYGGLANSWDYGPFGVVLKNNLKDAWWNKFVAKNKYNVGLDSAILMNPRVWEASGHLANFSDPLMDCKNCKTRYRADKLIEDVSNAPCEGWSNEKMENYIKENHIKCPTCGKEDFTSIRQFHLMFKTFMGVVEDSKSTIYLRPETAQGIFANFKNVQRSCRLKVPFGIGQIGKSFRNEITPGNFIFRTREFEQMELEFFCKPDTDLEWFSYWRSECINFLDELGINKEKLHFRDHSKEELSFYSKATTDIEYKFPFGWGELWGIADRTDYDLSQHMKYSGESLEYLDPETNKKYIPYVVEPSLGVDRLFLTVVCDAYDEEVLENGETRIVLRFKPSLAPYKVAVLPLSKQLNEQASQLFADLQKKFVVDYDETGSIGKRYRRQDAVGTPFCVTYDFDSINDNMVTVRERDSMEQTRIKIDELEKYLESKINN